ncbi:alpha/beta hydrolase [Ligilactobacillus sp. WILCCON 0076]|uniref:Alpha/beta hydrolase n=1 Tax=Ligilactobacillus ubinensis TaxID=2876789 RepID=A0A9X2FK08_9LACO|nr:alpha/beta hydrolase [Ligilactobacillus ubinensis]MCP0885738.1 alpha/beta hydrolase [Ligilactobacillus ubinensis]
MEIIVNFLKLLLIVLVVGIVSLIITINVTPRLTVALLRHSFDKEAIKPKEYKTYAQQVDITKNIKYSSKYKNSKLDIYSRKENKNKPTIIWVHGGAFVAGDKADVQYWAMKMAYDGYNVVSINYSLAPDNYYPAQIKQTGDAIRYIVANYSSKLNVKRIVIGGDSAGAHIASQVIAAQYNSELARKINYQPINKTKIVGGLLYCGAYDVKPLANLKDKNFMTKLFVNQLGWAYLGKKKWQKAKMIEYASTVDYVNAKFPPIFITDGNSGSFETQGIALYKKLQEKQVTVKKLFFDKTQKVGHEYQFDLDTKPAKKCFKETLSFLNDL